MSASLTLACLWAVAACVIAMLPSKRNHWPAAYVLITLGIPLLGYITLQHGPWVALILAAQNVLGLLPLPGSWPEHCDASNSTSIQSGLVP